MKKYTQEELNLIISEHFKWLIRDGGSRANLRGANLSDANLIGANLRGANLSDATLIGANLRGANLSDANLIGANLRGANLSDANLSDANLRVANLIGANLIGATLIDANLRVANLIGANLSDATLIGANLRGANLSDANLRGASLLATIGNKKSIKSISCERYDICYTSEMMQIGCERHSIKEWFSFDDDKILSMELGALDWWLKWKPVLKNIIDISPCEKTK